MEDIGTMGHANQLNLLGETVGSFPNFPKLHHLHHCSMRTSWFVFRKTEFFKTHFLRLSLSATNVFFSFKYKIAKTLLSLSVQIRIHIN